MTAEPVNAYVGVGAIVSIRVVVACKRIRGGSDADSLGPNGHSEKTGRCDKPAC